MVRGNEGVSRLASQKNGTIEYNKIRIFYEKKGDFRFFSQLSMMKYIERLIRKSGIAFGFSKGFHPRIKISSLPPIPVFAIGLDEVVELFLDAGITEDKILNRLNTMLDDFEFKKGVNGTLILNNVTAGALTPLIVGDEATTFPCSGLGNVDVSAGYQLGSIGAGETFALPLDSISAYLKGGITMTGADAMEAQILEYA